MTPGEAWVGQFTKLKGTTEKEDYANPEAWQSPWRRGRRRRSRWTAQRHCGQQRSARSTRLDAAPQPSRRSQVLRAARGTIAVRVSWAALRSQGSECA